MEVLNYFIIILAFLTNNINSVEDSQGELRLSAVKFGNPLSRLVAFVIEEFYRQKSTEISILRVDKDAQSYIIQSGIINEIIYDVREPILIRLEAFDRLSTKEIDVGRFFNVFVLDSYESFRKIMENVTLEAFDFRGFFTIVLTSVERNYTHLVTRILKDCWDLHVVNVNVVTYDPYKTDRAFLHTYFPYKPEKCGQVKSVISGVFHEDHFINKITIFPDKFSDFYGCPLTIGTFNFPPYMMITSMDNESYYFSGVEGIVARVLAQRLNFTLKYKSSEDRWGKVQGENSTGLNGMLFRGEVDFIAVCYPAVISDQDSPVASTIPYIITNLILIVPPGRSLTAMERILFPFKITVWTSILAVFIIWTVVVISSKFLPVRKRIFIFGFNNHFPFVNVINVFLGGSMPSSPRRNFARFLLISWIILSLVVRTSYQGALFGFLKESKGHLHVNSIEEMQEEGFKIYCTEELARHFPLKQMYGSMLATTDSRKAESFRKQIVDNSSFKGAVISTEFTQSYLNQQLYRKGIRYHSVRHETLLYPVSIITQRYSHLLKSFDTELWKLIENGLISKWVSEFYDSKYVKPQPDKGLHKPLTMEQVQGIFFIYFIMIGFSFLVFLLELLSQKCTFLRQFFNFFN
ncbi:uncharacterized protein LOC132263400 [Phlebotomus argentipes]|uniref:uncharacterized protein LOC132263400 n=1 Tax=Phlebotomus argentipes TaxID=94469 RepID=UPI002892FF43|nr:uncharacterized protein LOC132263400 [Phlebotomus argentipes]